MVYPKFFAYENSDKIKLESDKDGLGFDTALDVACRHRRRGVNFRKKNYQLLATQPISPVYGPPDKSRMIFIREAMVYLDH